MYKMSQNWINRIYNWSNQQKKKSKILLRFLQPITMKRKEKTEFDDKRLIMIKKNDDDDDCLSRFAFCLLWLSFQSKSSQSQWCWYLLILRNTHTHIQCTVCNSINDSFYFFLFVHSFKVSEKKNPNIKREKNQIHKGDTHVEVRKTKWDTSRTY